MNAQEGSMLMSEIITINNRDVKVKEFNSQRVVTFKDIDMVHERADGTARKRFNDNKKRFIKNTDYFILKPADIQMSENRTTGISNVNNAGTVFITESGYLMLVKSLTDDLAWKVQRELVNNYFRGRQIIDDLSNLSPQLQFLINMELKQKELEKRQKEQQKQITGIKDALVDDVENWRKWVNKNLRAIGLEVQGGFSEAYIKSYEMLEGRAGCDLEKRLNNKIERLKKNGATKTKIRNTGKLDVIEEDKKLKEIYTSIVKEMAIKHLK